MAPLSYHCYHCERRISSDVEIVSCPRCNEQFIALIENEQEDQDIAAEAPHVFYDNNGQLREIRFQSSPGQDLSIQYVINTLMTSLDGMASFLNPRGVDNLISRLVEGHTPAATPTSQSFLDKLPRLKPRPSKGKSAEGSLSNGKATCASVEQGKGEGAGHATCSVGEQCNVCWEEYKEDEPVLQLPCGHCFHEGCILTWLKERNTCPICRDPLPMDPPSDEEQRPAPEPVHVEPAPGDSGGGGGGGGEGSSAGPQPTRIRNPIARLRARINPPSIPRSHPIPSDPPTRLQITRVSPWTAPAALRPSVPASGPVSHPLDDPPQPDATQLAAQSAEFTSRLSQLSQQGNDLRERIHGLMQEREELVGAQQDLAQTRQGLMQEHVILAQTRQELLAEQQRLTVEQQALLSRQMELVANARNRRMVGQASSGQESQARGEGPAQLPGFPATSTVGPSTLANSCPGLRSHPLSGDTFGAPNDGGVSEGMLTSPRDSDDSGHHPRGGSDGGLNGLHAQSGEYPADTDVCMDADSDVEMRID